MDSGIFATLQTSFNLVDQRARTELLELAESKGMGIIIKRPIANGAWGKDRSPSTYADEYFERAKVMAQMGPIPGAPEDPVLLAMGFALAHPVVDTIIVGTHNPSHLIANVEMVERWPSVQAETVQELHRRFDEVGGPWPQLK